MDSNTPIECVFAISLIAFFITAHLLVVRIFNWYIRKNKITYWPYYFTILVTGAATALFSIPLLASYYDASTGQDPQLSDTMIMGAIIAKETMNFGCGLIFAWATIIAVLSILLMVFQRMNTIESWPIIREKHFRRERISIIVILIAYVSMTGFVVVKDG